MFIAHKSCWKVANSPILKDPILWLRLAFQTRPFENRPDFDWSQESIEDQPPVEVTAPQCDLGTTNLLSLNGDYFGSDTDLGRIASKMSMMPLEIQAQVMRYLDRSLLTCLLKTKTFVTQLLPRIRDTSATLKPTLRNIYTDGLITKVYVRITYIMGPSYLGDISFAAGTHEGELTSVTVADRPIRGVQFALGRSGLRGIRILYEDETSSSWLGESSSCWIGVARGRDLSRLRIIADVGHIFQKIRDGGQGKGISGCQLRVTLGYTDRSA